MQKKSSRKKTEKKKETDQNSEKSVQDSVVTQDDSSNQPATTQPLQNLLSKLNNSDSFAPNPSISRSRLTTLLQGLKAEGNEETQLQSLMELCDFLSMGTEESMSGFSLDLFVPSLIALLNLDHNPDIMLISCRALTYLMEALPSSVSAVVSHQAVPLLCAKLLSIEYIDLAEQALQCLEKISYEHPLSILQNGGLMASLSFLDFFPTATQRLCVSIAANLCRQVPPENFESVADAIPILTNLLQYQEQKIVDKAVVCFVRLAESFYGQQSKLDALTQHGLPSHLLRLISASNTGVISFATYTLVIRLLTTLCVGSPALTHTLLKEGIAAFVQGTLTASGSDGSPDQLYEVLTLVNELLPLLPQEMHLLVNSRSLSVARNSFSNKAFAKLNKLQQNLDKVASESDQNESEDQQEEDIDSDDQSSPIVDKNMPSATDTQKTDPREMMYAKEPQLLINLAECLLLPILEVFTSSVNTGIRHKCLTAITKIFYFSTGDMLRDLLKNLSVSSFTATLLSSNDISFVAIALNLAEILMGKLPEIFHKYFRREGVVYEVDRIVSQKKQESEIGQPQQNADLELWVTEHAKKFKEAYFATNDEEANTSQELKQLKALNAALAAQMSLHPNDLDEKILVELRDLISVEEGISTFEFITSGLIDTLRMYLSRNETSHHLHRRTGIFCKVFLNPELAQNNGASTPFSILIRKLGQSLNKVEKFPVFLNDIAGTPAVLKYLTQPVKVKLQKKNNQDAIPEFGDNTVLVEPLATVSALEEFLVSRLAELQKSGSSQIDKSGTIANQVRSKQTEEDSSRDIETNENTNTQHTSEPKLKLHFDGVELQASMSVFQIVQASVRKSEGQSSVSEFALFPTYSLWDRTYTFLYEPVNHLEVATKDVRCSLSALELPYIQFLKDNEQLLFDTAVDNTLLNVLHLFRILFYLNRQWVQFGSKSLQTERVMISPNEFVNSKLSAKLLRQIQDPLSICGVSFPTWCHELVSKCFFLFPFETRKLYFQCTSFGIARALLAVQQISGTPLLTGRNGDLRVGRIQRQKVRISRTQILHSAMKVMELYGRSKAILEVEYFGEVGTGLGPTLEFYTLTSRELQRVDLRLWRDDTSKNRTIQGNITEFVKTTKGLFPALLKRSTDNSDILKLFKFTGIFVAKALLDNRLLDLHFSVPFLKWMTGAVLTFSDLKFIEPDLFYSLEKLKTLCTKKKELLAMFEQASQEYNSEIAKITLEGSTIEELELDFTLPGHEHIELKLDGSKLAVNLDNLEEYLDLVVAYHLQHGVEMQLRSFKEGFDSVFLMDNLSAFSVEELETLICGVDQAPWDVATLVDNTRCDHGYTHNSATVKNLLEVMSQFTPEEQRKFLLFVTGSPKLPLGGFKSLEPKLTIVRKEPISGKEDPDSYLPSVNCCFYYLKLPEYSSKTILKEKLMFAVEHGQGTFSFN